MSDRFTRFPSELAAQARTVLLPGNIPALLIHPDWRTPAPTMIWLHGRTANKELDPGRYLRWLRAGIAACAIDQPGHGQRADPLLQAPASTLTVMERSITEIDRVVESLGDPSFQGVFDLDRLGLGGMSLGGMVSLRRLCDDHPFIAASVECTSGWLNALYFPHESAIAEIRSLPRWPIDHPREKVAALDPMAHLDSLRPVPLISMHSEQDRVVPWPVQRRFLAALGAHYRTRPSPPPISIVTWPETGAPEEHSGFGRVSNDAKTLQTEFLRTHLRV